MIKIAKALCAILLAATATAGYAQQLKLSDEVKNSMNQVSPDQIKADIAYLADDKLLGRAPGTPGYQMAVDYVVDRLKSLNVKPAGENGTWIQTVKFRKAFSSDGVMTLDGNELKKRH